MSKRRVIFSTTVVVSLLCDAFFGGMRRTRVDRDRAYHPDVCFEGGRGSGGRRCGGMEIGGNEGVDRDHLFQTKSG